MGSASGPGPARGRRYARESARLEHLGVRTADGAASWPCNTTLYMNWDRWYDTVATYSRSGAKALSDVFTRSVSVEIARPPDEVFLLLPTPAGPLWDESVDTRGAHLARADRGGEHGAHGAALNGARYVLTWRIVEHDPPSRQTIESTSGPFPHHAGLPAERAGRRDPGGVLGDGTPEWRAPSAPAGDRAQHAAKPRPGLSAPPSSTWKPAPPLGPSSARRPRRDSHPTAAPSTSPTSGASGTSVVRATTMPSTRPATAPSAIATPRLARESMSPALGGPRRRRRSPTLPHGVGQRRTRPQELRGDQRLGHRRASSRVPPRDRLPAAHRHAGRDRGLSGSRRRSGLPRGGRGPVGGARAGRQPVRGPRRPRGGLRNVPGPRAGERRRVQALLRVGHRRARRPDRLAHDLLDLGRRRSWPLSSGPRAARAESGRGRSPPRSPGG